MSDGADWWRLGIGLLIVFSFPVANLWRERRRRMQQKSEIAMPDDPTTTPPPGGQPQALNDMLPGDTEDYSAWVERLEPIARQRVGWMHDRITELTDRLRAAETERDGARARAERLVGECPLPERLDPEFKRIIRDRVVCGQFLDPEKTGTLLEVAVKTRRDLVETWTRLKHVAQDRDNMLVTERNLRRDLITAAARAKAAEAERDEARSEIMRLQDNDSAYDVGYQRADAAAGAALDRLRRERDEVQARLAAVEAERDQAVASAQRWHGHYRHAGKVIARLQRAIQTYWSACRAEQAVADADDWSPETAHAAGLATQNARDGLWRALNLPSPRATDAFAADPAPTAEEYSNG